MVARWARVLLPIAAWVAIIYLAVTGGSVFAIGALLILGLRLWSDRDPTSPNWRGCGRALAVHPRSFSRRSTSRRQPRNTRCRHLDATRVTRPHDLSEAIRRLAKAAAAAGEQAGYYDPHDPRHIFRREKRDAERGLAEGNLRLDVTLGGATFAAEGPGETVLEAFAAFREHTVRQARQARNPAVAAESPVSYEYSTSPAAETDAAAPDDQRPPDGHELLPVFLKERSIKTNAEVAAAIATWAKRHGDVEELTPDDAERLWRQSGRKVPSNIPRDMSAPATEGLTRVGTGRYAVTTYGERYIDDKITE